MKILNLKRKIFEKPAEEMSADEIISKFVRKKSGFKKVLILTFLFMLPAVCLFGLLKKVTTVQDKDITFSLADSSMSAIASKREVISIPSGMVKPNPFVPYRNIDGESVLSDIPKYDLVEPPEDLDAASDAARVMDTIVSGILYNKFGSSAILNIEGSDYLVKKGDTVNNYKIMDIQADSVTVKLGKNTYKAGIGEILTEGEIFVNEVSNLDKKFGGEKR